MPVTRAQRRARERAVGLPYGIPTEVLGQIYRQVNHPRTFGEVNSAFRGVHADTHFQKMRAQRIVEDLIRTNGGKVFVGIPIEYERIITEPIVLTTLFDYGCVFIANELDGISLISGKNIKHIAFKAVLGINSITSNPRYVPVGRINNLRTVDANDDADVSSVNVSVTAFARWVSEKLEENNPTLKNDLLRTINADLQNRIVTRHANNYTEMLAGLPDLENVGSTVNDVIRACFVPNIVILPVTKSAAEIVGDTIEITVQFAFNYPGRG